MVTSHSISGDKSCPADAGTSRSVPSTADGSNTNALPASTSTAESAKPASEALTPRDRAEVRRCRIVEYLDEKLVSATPEVAIIGGLTADFAQLALKVNEAVVGILGDRNLTGEYFEEMSKGADLLLKLGRQIERNTRLIAELSGN